MNRMLKMLLGAGVVAALYSPALAQDDASNYPSEPITLVVGFSPGGSTDTLARAITDKLSEILGQPVVVENRPGAGGYVGYRSVADAEPDGYTILLAENAIALGKALRPDEPLNPVEDLEAVGRLAMAPIAFIINADLEPNTLKEVIEFSKTNPEGLNVSSSGVGSVSHMTFEALSSALGIDAVHVPFSGGGEANAAVVGGHVHGIMQSIGSAARLTEEGSAKPIVVTAPERVDALPDVPTLKEEFPDLKTDVELRFWWGVFVPNGTPEPIKEKLADAMEELTSDPEARERLATINYDPAFAPAEEMSTLLKNEIANWSALVEERGIKPQ